MVQLKTNKGPGRRTVITDSAILKLETAFALGCNVKEALIFAELSKDSYSRLLQRQLIVLIVDRPCLCFLGDFCREGQLILKRYLANSQNDIYEIHRICSRKFKLTMSVLHDREGESTNCVR